MAENENNSMYTNRELSWLKFNQRVLEESEDSNVPLFERLKFLSIFQSNLDEFFMVRVGSLYDQNLINKSLLDSRTGMTPQQQLDAIYENVKNILPRKDISYFEVINLLSHEGIEHININNLSQDDYDYLNLYFLKEIYPLISPQIIDKRHPFPFLKNREIYVGVHISSKSGNVKLGLIPASGHFNRIIYVPSNDKSLRFILVEEIIYLFSQAIFKNQEILDKTIFKITRNADIDIDEAVVDFDLDYREAMQELLKKRKKLTPVRLEIQHDINASLLNTMCDFLTLNKNQVFSNSSPLDMSFVFALEPKLRKLGDFFFKPLIPQQCKLVDPNIPMLTQIQKRDLLLHYPYHSIKPFIRLLREAANDKNVVSIKITLYRVASNSKVVEALIEAAEKGKQVDVLVELRARFDEENNIDWSIRLQEAGCNVIYGLPGYKVHSKLLLITRKSGNDIEYITQVGTGNYNEKTSKLYTDLSLLTCNKQIGSDASIVFNSLFMGTVVESTSLLLVAPLCFKSRVINLIDNEIAIAKSNKPARIILKMNSVTDKVLIDKLVEASTAGVKIQMIIRGICCLKPGIVGKTENIEIRSIVGRFLEHSRIFVFGVGDREQMFISSADFMTRNTERRIEVAAPILAPELKNMISEIISISLADNQKARVSNSLGIYEKVLTNIDTIPVNMQDDLFLQAYQEAKEAEEKREQAKPLSPADKLRSWVQRMLKK